MAPTSRPRRALLWRPGVLPLSALLTRGARRLRRGPVDVLHLALPGLPDLAAGAGVRAAEQVRTAVAGRARAAAGRRALVGLVGDAVVVLGAGDPDAVLDAVRLPVHLVDGDPHVPVVAAGTCTGRTGDVVSDLLDAAALAAATAARTGATDAVAADAAQRRCEQERVRLEQLLRRAVPEGLLRLHYQPLVDLVTGAVTGVEALVRLQADDGELVAPTALLPVAEQTGLVVDLGTWVLRSACRQLAAWQTSAPGVHSVAVNVSACQLARPDFADVVLAALEDADLPARRLVLELTESVLLDAGPLAVQHLLRLRAHGVRAGVDDFGTGYACLTLLRRLPVSFLKVDRSFVAGLPGGDDDTVVRAVLGLAADLGLECVAEGIETPAQLAALQGLGAVTGQGYLLSPPLTPAQLVRVARRTLLPVREQAGEPACPVASASVVPHARTASA